MKKKLFAVLLVAVAAGMLLAVRQAGGMSGDSYFIDKTGHRTSGPEAPWLREFAEGMAKNGIDPAFLKWINREGRPTLPPGPFQSLASMESYPYPYPNAKAKWSEMVYVTRKGEIAFEGRFNWANEFSEDLAAVSVGGTWVESPSNGSATLEKNLWGYIDRTGKFVIPAQFSRALDFKDGLAAVCTQDPEAKVGGGGKWGFIDKTGNFVIPPQFDEAGSFSEALAPVLVDARKQPVSTSFAGEPSGLRFERTGGKFGYIDKSGGFVLKPQFDEAKEFSEGLAAVCVDRSEVVKGSEPRERVIDDRTVPYLSEFLTTQQWGYIDKKGSMVVPPSFVLAEPFSEGMAAVGRETALGLRFGYINKNGDILVPFEYDLADRFRNGKAAVLKSGVIHRLGAAQANWLSDD
ncbi:MAG: WG repeat-containing protein [Candidatus Hydrogenedentes bacterium]|nr:WG repeat-containing protein [Candidatus Hydrogenedentota bacterium]